MLHNQFWASLDLIEVFMVILKKQRREEKEEQEKKWYEELREERIEDIQTEMS